MLCHVESVTFTASRHDIKCGSVTEMYAKQSRAGSFMTVEFNRKCVRPRVRTSPLVSPLVSGSTA